MAQKVRLSEELKELNGEAMKIPNKDGELESYRLRDVLLRALMAPAEKLDPKEHIRRYDLGLKIQKEDEIELESDDIVMLKKLVAEIKMTPIIIGQALKMLEGQA